MSSATSETITPHESHTGTHGDDHVHDWDYIKIAIILGVITGLEVLTYYLDLSTTALILVLIPMMIVKFAMVAWFFMHLKQDSRIFSRLFVSGILLACLVYTIVFLTFDEFF
jgi:cytochrome c oxidase subunit 4